MSGILFGVRNSFGCCTIGSAGRLKSVADYKWRKYTGEVRPLKGRPAESVVVNNKPLKLVNKFCYLGDMIDAGGGTEENIVARITWLVEEIYRTLASTYLQCICQECCSLW